MNITICEKCGAELTHGDYPFCPHGSIFRQNSLHFEATLIYELPDGSHHFCGSNTDKPPVEGAKPILLDTLRKADAFVKSTNQREQEIMDIRAEHKRNHFDRVQREVRRQLLERLDRAGLSRSNAEAIMRDRDGLVPKEEVIRQFEAVARASGREFNRDAAEKMYEATQRTRRDPHYRQRPQADFQMEVWARDASNRVGHRDAATGWREKRS